ncbi:MerR family DNA-binding protein [Streptomyces sp. NPDC056361]|uniref:helix-turn-helix domain-containing protein n=1 Tax=Streptomyces sp. NPDC056361 TaxID=3345795 RepID=UPI0035D85658
MLVGDPRRRPVGRGGAGPYRRVREALHEGQHAHVTRVAFVLRAKQAGPALDGIRDLPRAGDPGDRRRRLAGHREVLRRRIAEAQACLDLGEGALDCGHADLATCPRFCEIVADATGTAGATRWYGPWPTGTPGGVAGV